MALRPTQSQYTAFARVFDYFNETLFDSQLPQPMLTFSRRRMTYGLFIANAWATDGLDPVHEIALNPDQLATRTECEVASTLVHEMCHEFHQLFGTPGRRGYHNAEFARIMEERGLWTTSDGTWDGKRTGQRITHKVMPGGMFERIFSGMSSSLFLPFVCLGSLERPSVRASSRSKTVYECRATSQKFWGGSRIAALDAATGEPFLRVDDPGATLALFDPFVVTLVKAALCLSPEQRQEVLRALGFVL